MPRVARELVGKPEIVPVLLEAFSRLGIAFSGRPPSPSKCWELYRMVHCLDVALALVSGTDLSLSGVGTGSIEPSGRYRWRESRRQQDFIASHLDLLGSLRGRPLAGVDLAAEVVPLLQEMGFDLDGCSVEEVLEC